MEMTRRPRPAALGLKVSPYGSECQDSPPEPEQRRPGCLHLWRAVNQTHLSALSSALPLTLIAGWSRWKIESWRTSWNISSRLNLWHQVALLFFTSFSHFSLRFLLFLLRKNTFVTWESAETEALVVLLPVLVRQHSVSSRSHPIWGPGYASSHSMWGYYWF